MFIEDGKTASLSNEPGVTMARYDNILQTIGNTPLVRLNRLAPEGVNVFVKVESFNPLGSVKDRMAHAIIEDAERRGALQPGQTVIEATSGNTGIGLAMVCAQKGYPLVVTMAESFSVERRKLLRFLGARVVLTPASEKGSGMLNKARELAEQHGWFSCRQFENEANAEVHTRTTAQEILSDLQGEPIFAFVSGFGTGGTLLGVARGLKAADANIRVIAAEPDNAQLLGSGIAQLRDGNAQPLGSHPRFRPHLMQGWSPDFVSRLTENAVQEHLIDAIVAVAGNEAVRRARELATKEGIFVGISSGATLEAALQVAHQAPPGSNIVCMLPDTGERYLSTPLFDGIEVDMNEAELELSRSTPGYRFDTAAPTAPPPQQPERTPVVPPDEEAEEFVRNAIGEHAVVLFALEWCEFCWAVRKLFGKLGVAYKSVDIDSVAFQDRELGTRVRAALKLHCGSPTIPQIYIGGVHVGGCMDLFQAVSDGRAFQLLSDAGIACQRATDLNAQQFLPQWLHPRKSA
ncbi:MAG TPA: cysteine synthase A [Polyangiaceae bacterium]|nr:cysteine synthase A [Polyangiaceae bacterium]